MNILKSIGAVLAGFIVIFALSIGADELMHSAGVLPREALPLQGAELSIAGVLAYRLVFSILGCYVAARLAPTEPMRHAMALGIFGVIFSTLGAITAQAMAPGWYSWALVVLALPCAWLGGRLAEGRFATPLNP